MRWDLAACVLMVTAPLAFHLEYHHFAVLSVDGAGLLCGSAALGAAAGMLAHRSPPWLRVAVLTVVTTLFLDLQFNPDDMVSGRLLVLGTALLVWALRSHFTKIATAAVGAMLLTLPFRSSPRSVAIWRAADAKPISSATRLVPIVHIVLDEHPSPSSFPADVPEAVRARERILDFYHRHGFRLFQRAYSRHFLTQYSIPAMLSPPEPGQVPPIPVKVKLHWRAPQARLFAWASAAGYRVHILQSDYLDFCGSNREQLASCRTYRANSLRSLQLLRLDPLHRVWLECVYFVTTESYLVQKVIRIIHGAQVHAGGGQRSDGLIMATDQARAGMVLREMQRLRDRVHEGLAGEYQFAHLLQPHAPYEVDAGCRGRQEIASRLEKRMDITATWGTDSRRLGWALLASQVECLYTNLDSLIATIDSVAPPQGVLVVFHGDHGSRIVPFPLMPQTASLMTDEMVRDGFETLLAIRGPGVAAGLDSTPIAVQDAVFGLITGDSLLLRRATNPVPVVILDDYYDDTKWHVPLAAPALARGMNAEPSQDSSSRVATGVGAPAIAHELHGRRRRAEIANP